MVNIVKKAPTSHRGKSAEELGTDGPKEQDGKHRAASAEQLQADRRGAPLPSDVRVAAGS